MTRVHVYTCAAANYLPKVRVLFETVRRWRPEWRLHLMLADGDPPADALGDLPAGVEVHSIWSLPIAKPKTWAFCHSLIELATGIKPFGLLKLLARPDADAVVYLDPDTALFSPLASVEAAFATSQIVLTPHLTRPAQSHASIVADEICTAQHGIYNLGFIGVRAAPEGLAFARWWADRVYRFCREDIPNGLYTDQRWVDFAPAYFDAVTVLRDSSLNVAPWNLAQRRVGGEAPDRLTVDGTPLGFFHFSQVDAFADEALSGGETRIGDLVRWYRERTRPTPAEGLARGWTLGAFEDGEPITAAQRLVFRLRGDLQAAYPDPYGAGADSYRAWWRREARGEFPRLFKPGCEAEEMQRLSSALTTGHLGDLAPPEFAY